jgi:hypothetical protein
LTDHVTLPPGGRSVAGKISIASPRVFSLFEIKSPFVQPCK